MKSPNYIWVVEMKVDGHYTPTVGTGLTKCDAKITMNIWRETIPDRKFRLRKYVCHG